MRWNAASFTLGAVFIFCACDHSAEYQTLDYEIVAAEKSIKDPRVPTFLWEEWTTPTPETLDYGTFKAYLIEETPGSLGKKNFQVRYGEGGGDLDLANFVNPERTGLWSLAINVDHAEEKGSTLQVFYVSGARRRKLSGQVFGTGCGRVLEVTSYFKKMMKHRGLEVSSAGARDVSVMGGTFYFVVKNAKKVWLSRLSIADRNRDKFLCRESRS